MGYSAELVGEWVELGGDEPWLSNGELAWYEVVPAQDVCRVALLMGREDTDRFVGEKLHVVRLTSADTPMFGDPPDFERRFGFDDREEAMDFAGLMGCILVRAASEALKRSGA